MSAFVNYEPGSYRDRDGRVFYDQDGGVFRALSSRALTAWNDLQTTRFFPRSVESGAVVRSQALSPAEAQQVVGFENWAGALRHDVIPFVSYPFEWSFGMLQDAALLQLDLLDTALTEDFTLKDGTAYNVQWTGVRPVFVDVVSFERLLAGQTWAGYRQFCQTFLFPLMLQAYKQTPFQPWLRGRLDGITPDECWSLMSWRDFFRRGVPSHVCLHAWLQSRRATPETSTTSALAAAGFRKDLIRANAQGLKRIVSSLRWKPAPSAWSNYAEANGYAIADQRLKENFVRQAVHSKSWGLVWDVGCNTGTYSRIAAENAEQVVAIDADPLTVEQLYQSLKLEPDRRGAPILPLVSNLADQTGGLGWRGLERKSLPARGRPELTLCLALIHHLVIGAGVPMLELLDWFAELGTSLIIEFVAKGDPMVQSLLKNRRDRDKDYEQDVFERLLSAKFDVVRKEPLGSGTRTLYFAHSRGPR